MLNCTLLLSHTRENFLNSVQVSGSTVITVIYQILAGRIRLAQSQSIGSTPRTRSPTGGQIIFFVQLLIMFFWLFNIFLVDPTEFFIN